ncbi:UBA/TS-N domain containing protein [Trichomonas vaginalis G3]|uniref:UBA/TS-N domain containing protein n=1 Tax=Trichomonas vaginalis (strain ATCC PRA-98 / G3) TaxID=412133 RepID=A2FGW7_TRIV3|nr:ubiquitin-like family [Trichomonas vaginalis G3]EAX95871.1 UBA/TS-N domain containing protein [Trichomonas vaginalis G3]KAI5488688.1 ubiquitin-like family [Trichomonas vaginalis G3]|eukprot:XP_001308801.1 UBA/TS-N domain containing protein [Trichomonas vaginalis G3]
MKINLTFSNGDQANFDLENVNLVSTAKQMISDRFRIPINELEISLNDEILSDTTKFDSLKLDKSMVIACSRKLDAKQANKTQIQEINQSNVEYLKNLGYSKNDVNAALLKSGNDLILASAILRDGQNGKISNIAGNTDDTDSRDELPSIIDENLVNDNENNAQTGEETDSDLPQLLESNYKDNTSEKQSNEVKQNLQQVIPLDKQSSPSAEPGNVPAPENTVSSDQKSQDNTDESKKLTKKEKQERADKIINKAKQKKDAKKQKNQKSEVVKISDSSESSSDESDSNSDDSEDEKSSKQEKSEENTKSDSDNSEDSETSSSDSETNKLKIVDPSDTVQKSKKGGRKPKKGTKTKESKEETKEEVKSRKRVKVATWDNEEEQLLKDLLLENAPVTPEKWTIISKSFERTKNNIIAHFKLLKKSNRFTKDELKLIEPEVKYAIEDLPSNDTYMKPPKKMLNISKLLNVFISLGGNWELISEKFKKFNAGYLIYVLFWMARHSAKDDPDPSFPDMIDKVVLEMRYNGRKDSEIEKSISKTSAVINRHIDFVLKSLVDPNNMKFFKMMKDAFPQQPPRGATYTKECIPSYVADLIEPTSDNLNLPLNLKVRKVDSEIILKFKPPESNLRISKAIKIFYGSKNWQNDLWHMFPTILPGYFQYIILLMHKKLTGVTEEDEDWTTEKIKNLLLMHSSGMTRKQMSEFFKCTQAQIRTKLVAIEKQLNLTTSIKDFLEEYPKLSAKKPEYDEEMFPTFVDDAIKSYCANKKK